MSGPNENEDETTTYDGEGGVGIGSTFRQLMYAVKFGESNFLLSGRVNGNSRVLYNRDPQTRVSALIDTASRDRVDEWVDEAVAGGAKRLRDGVPTESGSSVW